jgi:hypothetical protein
MGDDRGMGEPIYSLAYGDPDSGLAMPSPDHDPSAPSQPDLELVQCEICNRKICRCQKGEAPAHAGRRRRRITEDLFRCRLPLVIKGQKIPCNALVWRRPDKMREHLCDHLNEAEISALDDSQLQIHYANAARIAQEGIYDDETESDDDD